MKRLIITILFSAVISAFGQPFPDLRTEINQTSFDKILTSMDIPLVLFEHNSPFPRSLTATDQISKFDDESDKVYSYNDMQSLFSWALDGDLTSMADVNDNDLKNEIKKQWRISMEPINEVIANYQYAKKNGTAIDYKGPSESDFDGGDFPMKMIQNWPSAKIKDIFSVLSKTTVITQDFVRLHLAYAKAELYDKPSLTVNSPNFKATNIMVKVSATGELWTKVPRFKCCKYILGICVWPCIDRWEWVRVKSASASAKIGSNVSINFQTQGLKIFAGALFDKLYFDYPILREINLAAIGNLYLKNKKFELYDVSTFVASIPYINKKFRIKEIVLPPRNGGVTVEVNITNQ